MQNIRIITEGGCYSLDEKMGQTYIHFDQANTLAQRDYKQPQMVVYEVETNDGRKDSQKINSIRV